jgi:hypothetical protein
VNGKAGDHPLTDIVRYQLPVFSPEVDNLIRRIVRLVGERRFSDDLDLLDPPPTQELEPRLRALYADYRRDALERGWEVEDDA